ncbi:MAG TPA: hypothetical protein VGL72_13515 [Bryobacteraceae bacterium]|jgi:hypothetical protein
MLRRSFTAVIEKNTTWTANFETEPYEAAWATEARWFVRVVTITGSDASLSVTPQISPDGLFWCDEGHARLLMSQPGLYSFPLRDFGGWLRLRAQVSGEMPSIKVMIYLVLKE